MEPADEVAIVYDWLVREHGLTAGEADDVLAGRTVLRSGRKCPECGATKRPHGMDCSLWRDDLSQPMKGKPAHAHD